MTTKTLPQEVTALPDQPIIERWIDRCKSAHTRRIYRRHAMQFLTFTGKPLAETNATDVKLFIESLTSLSPSSRSTTVANLKSFFVYSYRNDQIGTDPIVLIGKSVIVRDGIAEKIINKKDVVSMILHEDDDRNCAIVILAYSCGLTVSELSALCWGDITETQSGAMSLRVHRAPSSTRNVILSEANWRTLAGLRRNSLSNDPVFRSRKGGHLHVSAVHNVIKAAALKAGLSVRLSAYWLRHSHVVHKIADGISDRDIKAAIGSKGPDTIRRYRGSM